MNLRLSHLAALVTASVLVAILGGAYATYRAAGDEFREVLDDDLQNQSRMLARLLAAEQVDLPALELDGILRKTFRTDDEDTLWVSVYDVPTGRLASNLRHNLPLSQVSSGRISLEHAGHSWQGYQRREGDLVVQLLRRDDLYRDIEEDVLEEISAPAVIGGGLTLLLLGLFLAFLLRPLSRLVRQLETRNADSLAPVTLETPALEMRILRDTLNRLISGIDDVLKRERQFASDVAHELRTPLTTLKLELAGPEPDLPALKAEVDRLARLVTQLLTLARLEQGRWRESFVGIALDELVAGEVERYAGRVARAGMHLESTLAHRSVTGDPTLLQALLQNLLNNVLAHCPPGTGLKVAVIDEDGRTVLEVSDTGPGLSPELRNRLSHGATRLDSRSEGLGLGLAICQRIAQIHGAMLEFVERGDGAPGLRVRVVFPP